MWKEDYCPVCKTELVKKDSFPRSNLSDFYKVECPALGYGGHSHYDVRTNSAGSMYYESGIIFPYLIESYLQGNSNVYKYNEEKLCFSRKVILDVPYIKIPWDDLEAARDKIRLYLLMS